MILHELIAGILEISDFEAAILKKWPKLVVVSPSIFSGNIANMIPEGPHNKMVPLSTTHGGSWGGGGGARGPPLTHGLHILHSDNRLVVYVLLQKVRHN